MQLFKAAHASSTLGHAAQINEGSSTPAKSAQVGKGNAVKCSTVLVSVSLSVLL
jgi:hypothetical protein